MSRWLVWTRLLTMTAIMAVVGVAALIVSAGWSLRETVMISTNTYEAALVVMVLLVLSYVYF